MPLGTLDVIGLVGDAIGFADVVYGLAKDGIDSDGFQNFLDPDAEMNAHFEQVNGRLDEMQSEITDALDALQADMGAEFTEAAVARMTEPLSGVLGALGEVSSLSAMRDGARKDAFADELTINASIEMQKLLTAAREVIDGGDLFEVGIAISSVTAGIGGRIQLANLVQDGGYRAPSVQEDIKAVADLMKAAKPILAKELTTGDNSLEVWGTDTRTFLRVEVDSDVADTGHIIFNTLQDMHMRRYTGDSFKEVTSSSTDFAVIEVAHIVTIDNDFYRYPTLFAPGIGPVPSPDDRLDRPHTETWTIDTRSDFGRQQLDYALKMSNFVDQMEEKVIEGIFEDMGFSGQLENLADLGSGADIRPGTEGDDWRSGLNGDDFIYGHGGNDVLQGLNGSDYLRGDDGDDQLYGHGDNDILKGGAGNDRLYGGQENDVLTGGEGADVFVFSAVPGTDLITDFEQGVDKIDLVETAGPGLNGGWFADMDRGAHSFHIAQGAAKDSNDFIIQDGNKVYYDADGNGEAEAIHFLTLGTDITLVASDFI